MEVEGAAEPTRVEEAVLLPKKQVEAVVQKAGVAVEEGRKPAPCLSSLQADTFSWQNKMGISRWAAILL